MRSGYVQYVQGIQPNVPAHTSCRHGLYYIFLFLSLFQPVFPYLFHLMKPIQYEQDQSWASSYKSAQKIFLFSVLTEKISVFPQKIWCPYEAPKIANSP